MGLDHSWVSCDRATTLKSWRHTLLIDLFLTDRRSWSTDGLPMMLALDAVIAAPDDFLNVLFDLIIVGSDWLWLLPSFAVVPSCLDGLIVLLILTPCRPKHLVLTYVRIALLLLIKWLSGVILVYYPLVLRLVESLHRLTGLFLDSEFLDAEVVSDAFMSISFHMTVIFKLYFCLWKYLVLAENWCVLLVWNGADVVLGVYNIAHLVLMQLFAWFLSRVSFQQIRIQSQWNLHRLLMSARFGPIAVDTLIVNWPRLFSAWVVDDSRPLHKAAGVIGSLNFTFLETVKHLVLSKHIMLAWHQVAHLSHVSL